MRPMKSIPKITYRGGMPEQDLLTVMPEKFVCQLYECNRSHLVALTHVITRVTQYISILQLTATEAEVLSLIGEECSVRPAEVILTEPPLTQPAAQPAQNENANPALN